MFVVVREKDKTRLFKAFVGNAPIKNWTICNPPVTFPGVCKFPCFKPWDTKLNQVAEFGPDAFPLFPNQRSQPPPEPFISPLKQVFHVSKSEVIQPSCDVLAQCFLPPFISPTVAATGQFPDFRFHLFYTLPVDADFAPILCKVKSIAQKLYVFDVGNYRLVLIYFQVQFTFDVFRDA